MSVAPNFSYGYSQQVSITPDRQPTFSVAPTVLDDGSLREPFDPIDEAYGAGLPAPDLAAATKLITRAHVLAGQEYASLIDTLRSGASGLDSLQLDGLHDRLAVLESLDGRIDNDPDLARIYVTERTPQSVIASPLGAAALDPLLYPVRSSDGHMSTSRFPG